MHPRTLSHRPHQHYSVLKGFPPVVPGSTAERMAEAMIALNTDGGATRERLLDTFTAGDLDLHGAEARKLANKRFYRCDGMPATCDREDRVEKGAQLIAGMIWAEGEVDTALLDAGFTPLELNDIKTDIMDRAAQLVVETGAVHRVQ